MEGDGLKPDGQRWSRRLVWSWDDMKRDWAFFRGSGGDAKEGRKWGICLGTAAGIGLCLVASGGLGAKVARVFGMVVDAKLVVALAGSMLALGVLAGKGKSWAALMLMVTFPAFMLAFLIAAGIETWPVLREVGGWAWAFKLLPLVAIAALWVRAAYLAWRSLRRGMNELPPVAANES